MKRYDLLNDLIERFNYKKYLEIGVRSPERCFDKVAAPHKDGVDPAGRCNYSQTSDEFFAHNRTTYDLVFVDGLHTKEQAYIDVQNALSFLSVNGTVVLHDCNPPTEWHQRDISRYQEGIEWTGCVWKAYCRLRAERGDLEMFVVDADWGLGIIRHGRQEPVPYDYSTVTYTTLDTNRAEILNLVSVDDWKDWLMLERTI